MVEHCGITYFENNMVEQKVAGPPKTVKVVMGLLNGNLFIVFGSMGDNSFQNWIWAEIKHLVGFLV